MQDNRNGKDLTDMAWGKMHAILDKEMPQKKDRKRYFIWMFIGALLAATAGAGLFLQNDKSDAISDKSISSISKSIEVEKTDAVHFEPTKNEILEATESPITESPITESTKIETSSTESSIAESPKSKSSVTKSTEFLQSHSNNKPVKETARISNTSKERNVSINEISKKKLDIPKSQQNEIIELSNAFNIDQTRRLNPKTDNQIGQSSNVNSPIKHLEHAVVIETVEREKDIRTKSDLNKVRSEGLNPTLRNTEEEKQLDDQLDNIKHLPQLPIPFLTKPILNVLDGISLPEVSVPASTRVVKSKSKLKILPGLYAGAHFNPVFNFGGYEFGLTLTAPISKRFSLSTGLGVADLNKKGFQRIGIFDDTVAPEGLSFQDGQFTNGVISLDLNRLSQVEVASSIKRLVYLQIPVTLNYKLNKRIDLSSGLNFSYLINASAEGKLIDNLNPAAELKDYVFSTSELLSANLLSRWDNQITAGLKVKFGKSLRLNAEYRYGLNHIIKSNGVDRGNQSNNGGIKDFNRTIFLGLNYTFPQKGSK